MVIVKKNLSEEYLKQSVMTANPAELIAMLFSSCIKNIKLAAICIDEQRDFDGANNYFLKAQKIIMELTECLDTSFEISSDLLSIYDFLLFSLREMNAKKDTKSVPDILDILVSLRDTWQQISSQGLSCSSW